MFSSERGHNVALYPERRESTGAKVKGARPVALPALAAAVQVARGSAKPDKAAVRQVRPFFHEDDPQD